LRDFHSLKVWEKAHELALAVYEASAGFPSHEIYGLTSQVRRAAVSIAANIAEGCGRNSEADLARFLQIAMGSASETQYHLLLARDLKILKTADHQHLEDRVSEVKRMLASLIQKLCARPKADGRPLKAESSARPAITVLRPVWLRPRPRWAIGPCHWRSMIVRAPMRGCVRYW
jgi:four helix bundle protein